MNSISNFERPAYRILAIHGFFGPDDNLYQEGAEIYFDGEPNEEMEPLNEAARVRLLSYLEKLDTLAREVSVKTGKAFISRPRSLDGGLEMATAVARSEMQIMGAKRVASDIAPVNDADTDETGSINPKRGRGRPRKDVQALSKVAVA